MKKRSINLKAQRYPLWNEGRSEVQLTKLLSLRLEKGKSNIYLVGRIFIQCKYLLLCIPKERLIMEEMKEIASIDEASEYLDKRLEGKKDNVYISPQQEFLGHASNLQAWIEHDYDTRILHRNLAFPLLKALADAGDKRALQRFREEVVIRANSSQRIFEYLLQEGFLEYLSREERKIISRKTNRIRVRIIIEDVFIGESLKDKINNSLKKYNRGIASILKKKKKHKDSEISKTQGDLFFSSYHL